LIIIRIRDSVTNLITTAETKMSMRILSVAIHLVLIGLVPIAQANNSAAAERQGAKLDAIEVLGQVLPEPRFAQIPVELQDGKVLAGKKSTSVALDVQPTVQDGNLRNLFARLPGVLVSELAQPGIFNLNYRGLGDPHESEFINVMENGLPIASDWFGYPTLYYFPPGGRLERIDFVRGGSGLLYGPQIGPSINLITRQPRLGSGWAGRSEHIGGSDRLYQTFNELSYGGECFAVLVDYEHRSSDGPRANADYRLDSGRVLLDFHPSERSAWQFELLQYQTSTGEPGRLSTAEFASNRDLVKTPFNRLYVDWYGLRLRNQTRLSDNWGLFAQYSHGGLDRLSRRSSAFVAPASPPGSTNIDLQEFKHNTLDLRLAGDVGNHTITSGFTLYRNDSPRARFSSANVASARNGTPVFVQDRETRYSAVFAEALLRFGHWSLTPGLRFDDLALGINESLLSPGLQRAAIQRDFARQEPLYSLGLMRDLPKQQQFYFNAASAYRPIRFDDVGNPTANLSLSNQPDPAKGRSLELGLRGSPIQGLYYDISLFRTDFDDKVEQLQISPSDIVRVNSGDARHQGAEMALEYDWRGLFGPDDHLLLFASAALLDAEIVASRDSNLVGRTPAFAPKRILRAGAAYRSFAGARYALTAHHVSAHFWRDDNRGAGSGNAAILAQVPSYTVADLNAEIPLHPQLRLLAGVNNLFDRNYFSRVRSDGVEPAPERAVYAGLRVTF